MNFKTLEVAKFLSAYPRLRTESRDEMAATLRKTYDIRGIDFPESNKSFFAMTNRVKIGGTTLHATALGAPANVSFVDMDGYRQALVFSGSAEVTIGGRKFHINDKIASIVPPNSSYSVSYKGVYQQLILQIEEDVLKRQIEIVDSGTRCPALGAQSLGPIGADRINRMKAIAVALAVHLSTPGLEESTAVIELEQVLRNSFLFENGMFAKTVLPPEGTQGRQARLLEDYIQANWSKPLTVEDIARECGTSVRNVYNQFQRRLGCSPMSYVRDLRLENARRSLQSNDETPSVLTVALQCGFASFGHFARRYREKFGELPSETILKNRSSELRRWI